MGDVGNAAAQRVGKTEEPELIGKTETPESVHGAEASAPEGPKGLGGWLTLPAIGLVLGPIGIASVLLMELGVADELAGTGYGGLLAFHVVLQLGLLILSVFAAFRFFGKKSNAPRVMIVLYLANLAVSATFLAATGAVGDSEVALGAAEDVLRALIAAAIWVPYFRKSKRVKATFTR